MVKRYEVSEKYVGTGEYVGQMVVCSDGDYVEFADYDSLAARLAEAMAVLDLEREARTRAEERLAEAERALRVCAEDLAARNAGGHGFFNAAARAIEGYFNEPSLRRIADSAPAAREE